MIKVTNLATGEERHYSAAIGPRQAVICAYAQSRGDNNTWHYGKYTDQVVAGKWTFNLGDWCTLRVPEPGEPWTVAQAKELLPEVRIEIDGKVHAARVAGRCNRFATVYPIDMPSYGLEFSWQTIAACLSSGKALDGN